MDLVDEEVVGFTLEVLHLAGACSTRGSVEPFGVFRVSLAGKELKATEVHVCEESMIKAG